MKIPEAIGSAIAIVILMLFLVGLASLITSRLHRSCRIAGVFASLLFSLGVIGTGLLACRYWADQLRTLWVKLCFGRSKKTTPTPKSTYHVCESLWLFSELNKGLSAGPYISRPGGTVQQIANSTVDSIRDKISRCNSSEKSGHGLRRCLLRRSFVRQRNDSLYY